MGALIGAQTFGVRNQIEEDVIRRRREETAPRTLCVRGAGTSTTLPALAYDAPALRKNRHAKNANAAAARKAHQYCSMYIIIVCVTPRNR